MSSFLRVPQFFGFIPFRVIDNRFVESPCAEILNLVLTVIFATFTISAVIGDFILPKNLCSDPLYTVTDKLILFGSVPFIMNCLWRNRNILINITSLDYDPSMSKLVSRFFLFLIVFIQIIFNISITFANISQFKNCPIYGKIGYTGAIWYWSAFDIFFNFICERTGEKLKSEMLVLKNHLHLTDPREFFAIKEKILKAMFNIKESYAVLGPYALLTAACLVGQVISLFDFVLLDLRIISSVVFMFTMTSILLMRTAHICWMTALPKTYVSS